MLDATVVYYTSNREFPVFEDSVKTLLAKTIGKLPLISVSQQPIAFGKNFCVGDIGVSELNVVRQLRIGAEEATTRFIIPVESDCFYPPDFFTHEPEHDDRFYYAEESYIIWHGACTFWPKPLREFTSIVGKDLLIATLDYILANQPKHYPRVLETISKHETFATSAPVVTVKTKRQMHKNHPFSRRGFQGKLPLWGTGQEMWRKHPCKS